MSFGTKIYTWLYGNLVGMDQFKNKYYCNSKNFKSETTKRWVIFNGEIEASKIPSHWHAWLHKTINDPPINYFHKHSWQKEHLPNFTGTSKAYFPSSYPLSKSRESLKVKKDYKKWQP
jgi:NADH:ubiquinone oxidoreductase subunit